MRPPVSVVPEQLRVDLYFVHVTTSLGEHRAGQPRAGVFLILGRPALGERRD